MGFPKQEHWSGLPLPSPGDYSALNVLHSSLDLILIKQQIHNRWGFPGGSDGRESACSVGDLGLIPGWGRSPGEGNGNPLQDSCLKNSLDRGALWATVHGVAKSWTQRSN